MHRRQPVQPDVAVELVDHAGDAFGVGEVVAGGEGVLGVQTDAQARAVHRAQHLAQLIEFRADVLAHAGHILQAQDWAFGGLIQHPVDGLHHLGKDSLVAGPAVAAGVKYHAAGADLVGQLHVLHQRRYGLLHVVRVGVAQVDEIDSVQERRCQACLRVPFPEIIRLGVGQRLETPRASGRAENLDGFRADVNGPINRVADTAGGGNVSADYHSGFLNNSFAWMDRTFWI